MSGKLSDERFAKMLGDFETEQKNLITGTAALRAEVEEIKGKTADLQSFMKIVDRCADITELTADVARTFVDRVIVHEADYDSIPHQRQRSPKARSQDGCTHLLEFHRGI